MQIPMLKRRLNEAFTQGKRKPYARLVVQVKVIKCLVSLCKG